MFGFLDDVIGGVVSGVFGLGGQEMTNDANAANARELMEWNSAEAVKARQFDAEQGAIARNYNRIEASKAREWTRMMSGTAHRREMYDLKKAGLNPILAVTKGGASAPSGQAASAAAVKGGQASGGQVPHYESSIAKGLSTAMDHIRSRSEVERTKAETATAQETKKLTERSADNKLKEGELIDAQVRETDARAVEAKMSTARQSALINEIQQNVLLKQAETAESWKRGFHESYKLKKTREEIPGVSLENEARGLAMPGHRTESEIDESYWGKAARWMGRWNPFGSSASSILRALK